MFEWLKRKIAQWGWFAYDHEEHLKIIRANQYRSVHVNYTWSGDVEVSVCNTSKPFQVVCVLKVSKPNYNEIELKKHLEYEPLQISSESTASQLGEGNRETPNRNEGLEEGSKPGVSSSPCREVRGSTRGKKQC